MKRTATGSIISIVMAVALISQPASAQSLKDVFGAADAPVFYLGIDYSKAKLIDDVTANERDIKERQFAGINDLILTETKKFDLNRAFHKSNVDHDISAVQKRNDNADADQIKSTNSADFHRFKESDISSEVKSMDYPDKKGVGVVFIVEAMSKSAKASAIWVTFVDMKSKKVLLTERIEAKTSAGFGFRNYWASSIKNLLNEIEDRKYKEWKTKYA